MKDTSHESAVDGGKLRAPRQVLGVTLFPETTTDPPGWRIHVHMVERLNRRTAHFVNKIAHGP